MSRETESELHEIVGDGPVLKSLLRQAIDAAKSNSTVLIIGEPGTGKELIARAIHRTGKRRNQGFIQIDCSNITPAQLEAALFGLERGRLEAASHGTLLLKHIENVSRELLTRLLRAVEQSGSDRPRSITAVPVDVRLIATASDLGHSFEDSRLREGLSPEFDLSTIRVPALRERREDIPLLAWHYVRKWARLMNKSVDAISPGTMKSLMNYSWPDNVRELDNVIERSVRSTESTELRFETPIERAKRA
jgi:DNA-binding NtrC family response regulator